MTQELAKSCRRAFVLAIRRATLDDLESMTSVYTAAWRQGFQHMFTAGVFVRDDFASDRAAECRDALTNDATDTFVVEADRIVIGFAAAHIQRSGAGLEDMHRSRCCTRVNH